MSSYYDKWLRNDEQLLVIVQYFTVSVKIYRILTLLTYYHFDITSKRVGLPRFVSVSAELLDS